MSSSSSSTSPTREADEKQNVIGSDSMNEEGDMVVLDASAGHVNTGNLKLAKDGHTILHPQPSSNPHDPLNWSWRKKHLMLFIVAFTGFLGDFAACCGIPLIQVQARYWNITPDVVNYNNSLAVAMLAIGSIFWAIISTFWGRLPVMLWATVLGAVCVLISAATTSFPVYYGFRSLTAFMLVSYQVVGLACVKDMFFFHEHARKTGIWVAFFIVSPYLSPLLAYFVLAGTGENTIDGGNWRALIYLVFGVVCLDLVLIVLFAEETFYNRAIPVDSQPARGSRIPRLVGIWQIQNRAYFPTVWESCKRFFSLLAKPVVLPALLYYMMIFMWAIGINTSTAIIFLTPRPEGYGYLPKAVGFVSFTPIVGALVGELFGHFFNDFIAKRYVKKHAGVFHIEARLPTTYVAGALMIPGLVVVGQALQFHQSIGIVVIGWGMYICGVMTATVAISTYLLDAFPLRGAEVAGLINFFRSIGGFQVPYYETSWGQNMGYHRSFGIQAGTVAAAHIIIVLLQVLGPRLRKRKGRESH